MTTPEDVLGMEAPAGDFLCDMDANTWGIEFLDFAIRDVDRDRTVFSVSRGDAADPEIVRADSPRQIDYTLPASFLDTRTVSTSLRFKVGERAVPGLRMIERFYFRGRLVRSFDFSFPFCVPDAENEWESVYELPELSADERAAMVASPFESVSDSYYFVDDKLVMHNKARYRYREDAE